MHSSPATEHFTKQRERCAQALSGTCSLFFLGLFNCACQYKRGLCDWVHLYIFLLQPHQNEFPPHLMVQGKQTFCYTANTPSVGVFSLCVIVSLKKKKKGLQSQRLDVFIGHSNKLIEPPLLSTKYSSTKNILRLSSSDIIVSPNSLCK